MCQVLRVQSQGPVAAEAYRLSYFPIAHWSFVPSAEAAEERSGARVQISHHVENFFRCLGAVSNPGPVAFVRAFVGVCLLLQWFVYRAGLPSHPQVLVAENG